MARRWSPIWKVTKEEFVTIVNSSNTVKEVLENFGLQSKGRNYETLKKRCDEEGIDYSRLLINAEEARINRLKNMKQKIPLEDILVEDSGYNRGHLKKRLIDQEILKNRCSICGLEGEWNGKPISLQLDHINGNSRDNRLHNLRLVCPNCHSQTENFAGKKLKKKAKPVCEVCGKEASRNAKRCKSCVMKNKI